VKTFKLTAIFFLLFSGVFGVTAFHHHMRLRADSKLIGPAAAISSDHSTAYTSFTFDKTIPPMDDNDLLADDSLDDDDDGYFSPKEKISSENNLCTDFTSYNYNLNNCCKGLQFSSHSATSYHPHRNFISRRVFRI
jgi:hypothetical protein